MTVVGPQKTIYKMIGVSHTAIMGGSGTGPRIAVIGLGQGLHLAGWAQRVGLDVVAVCDHDPSRLGGAGDLSPRFEHWQDLLDLELDGVILADDFDTHAPLAIAFLERGVHVLSETAACTSEEGGRRLIAAEAASSATYSFAENYVAHPHVRLIREVVDRGELGQVELVEADYLHGLSPEALAALIGGPEHWRGRIAPTAYCTHTLSPVLAITGAYPVEVAAHAVVESSRPSAVVMVVRLSTGALAITRHGFLQGEPDSHWSWVSLRGDRGMAESLRALADRAWSVRVRLEAWASGTDKVRDEVRTPPTLELNGEEVPRSAEGTAIVLSAFRATMETGAPPLIPVRPAVAASLVGVAAAESLLGGASPVPVPRLD
jgi:predicted dehydrogenase